MTVNIIQGDCLEVLKTLPEKSVNCCVTSPPYYGLRDYGVDGQIGLETTPTEYVDKLVAVFREIRRVLRDDGTLWLNLGDSYAHSLRQAGEENAGELSRKSKGVIKDGYKPIPNGYKEKDLIGIPWRVAFALQQPYYTGLIKDERDRTWMAGLIDGEGCLTILNCSSPHNSGNSYPPIMQVRMCDLEPLQKIVDITGLGSRSPKQEPPSQITQRPSYQWRVHARKAANLAAELYPYLLVKKKQAIILWNMQKVRESYTAIRGTTIPKSILDKQLYLHGLIQEVNKDKDKVDLPSWLEEPASMYENGWWLRSDCIWSKPNPMPESVKDRPTKAHEYIFLLAKSAKYYYDAEAIYEPANFDGRKQTVFNGSDKYQNGNEYTINNGNPHERWPKRLYPNGNNQTLHDYKHSGYYKEDGSELFRRDEDGLPARNKRSVWTVTTKPFSGAHFAVFPDDLIEPCILAGSPEGGTVLDPFNGAGTTGIVSIRHNRNYIGIELNPAYIELTKQRMNGTAVYLEGIL